MSDKFKAFEAGVQRRREDLVKLRMSKLDEALTVKLPE